MSKNKTVRNVFFTIFCLFACISLGYAESCSSVGSNMLRMSLIFAVTASIPEPVVQTVLGASGTANA